MMKTLKERFDEKWVEDENGCWLWTGHIDSKGYGRFAGMDGEFRAHRISYGLHNGEIPDSGWILHKCDVRNCVNPEHLFLGDNDANMQDKCEKERQTRGVCVHTAVLTEESVIKIRKLYVVGDTTIKNLAQQFGVSQTAVQNVVSYTSWKHLL